MVTHLTQGLQAFTIISIEWGRGSMCQGKCADSLSVIVLINIYKHLLNSRDARTLKQISKFIGIIFSQSLYENY